MTSGRDSGMNRLVKNISDKIEQVPAVKGKVSKFYSGFVKKYNFEALKLYSESCSFILLLHYIYLIT